MIKSVLASAALCSAFSAFAATDLVSDGSFESVAVDAGTFADFAAIAGWTATSGSIEVRDADVGTAADGINYVELDSTANSAMSTTLATVAGETYTLSFRYSNRADGVAVDSNGLSYDVGAGAVAVPVAAENTGSDNAWTLYTTTFTATSATTTLSFAATGTSDSFGSSLDDVSVTSVVPEPATMAMMAAGVLTLLGIGRRRRD
jgi:hypothetical protein